MLLTATQKRLIERVVNVFETGGPDGDYGAISIFHDGPHDIRQITYGRSQTTEFGNLRELVGDYAAASGLFSADLAPFVERIGSIPLTDDAAFKALLRRAGREDPVMRQVQDLFFERRYFAPSQAWADEHGFTLPLSALVIYDSFIHSGGMLRIIREMLPENPPSSGGDERAWTTAYVNARHAWLGQHHRPVVRATIYRTACFMAELARHNWDLSLVPLVAKGVDVTA